MVTFNTTHEGISILKICWKPQRSSDEIRISQKCLKYFSKQGFERRKYTEDNTEKIWNRRLLLSNYNSDATYALKSLRYLPITPIHFQLQR